MYHVSAQGVDERMINVHYYYYWNDGLDYAQVCPSRNSQVQATHCQS